MDTKKYLDLVGLKHYDSKIKTFIANSITNAEAKYTDSLVKKDENGAIIDPWQIITDETLLTQAPTTKAVLDYVGEFAKSVKDTVAGLSVNNKTFGENGAVVLYAGDIKMSNAEDAETVKEKIEDLETSIGNISVTEGSSVENYVTLEVKEVEGVEGAYTVTINDSDLVTEFAAVRKEISDGDTATLKDAKDYTDEVAGEYSEGDNEGTGLRGEIETAIKAEEEARKAADEALGERIDDIVAGAKTYSVTKITEGLGANVETAYQLYEIVGETETAVGPLIEIPKDDSLVDVAITTDEKGNKVVKFTYNLADGTEKEVELDLAAYITESEYGDGLKVTDGVISVKIDDATETFLTVGEGGVKLSGVQDAINAGDEAILKSAKDYTDEKLGELPGSYVTSFGGKTGEITLSTGNVTLEMVDNALKASYDDTNKDGISWKETQAITTDEIDALFV